MRALPIETSRAPTGVPKPEFELRMLLRGTADLAADFLESLDTRRVFPDVSRDELLAALGQPLQDEPRAADKVLSELAAGAEPGVVSMPSGRYFGFVVGGVLPAALAADWLTSAWDQNAGLYVGGPSASVVEQVVHGWLCDLLGLPGQSSIGFVTGTQMAHVTGLAAARYDVLHRAGWDVGRDGLTGAPRVRVLVGAKRHVTVDRALRLLGLGMPTVVPADDQGRLRVDALRDSLARGEGPMIVCAQVGEVNTGAIDPLLEIAAAARAAKAWLHVDGAFGLWAAASPRLRHLLEGVELADSWATDAHKWLNVPYDSGIVLCAHPQSHCAAMRVTQSYLIQNDGSQDMRDQLDWTPEASRRARGFAVYAALRSLGRNGLADLVERCCDAARLFAAGVPELPGGELVQEVVLNQVLFRFEDDARTDAILQRVQRAGAVWMSGTTWNERKAIRLSVSNWQTTDAEIDLALDEFRRAAQMRAPAGRRKSVKPEGRRCGGGSRTDRR
jgi:glutamate/tyrosine decarboxylase-like PLP-dependent enzyme